MESYEGKDSSKYEDQLIEFYTKSISQKELIASKYKEKSEILTEEISQIQDRLNNLLKENNKLRSDINTIEVALYAKDEQNFNLQQSMSYRLGYALLVGFKSWKNFKILLKTIKELIQEKKGVSQRKKYQHTRKEDDLYLTEKNSHSQKGIGFKKYFQYWKSEKKYSDNYIFKKELIVTENFINNKKKLDKKGLGFVIEENAHLDRVIRICLKAEKAIEVEKQAILTIDYLDDSGKSLQAIIDTPYSPALKKYYHYLSVNPKIYNNVLICPPQGTATVELSVRLWDNIEPIQFDGLFQICELQTGVSIVIPSYKGEKTILRCLSSIAKQNFDLRHLEVILVLNGERDSTRTKVEKFLKKNTLLDVNVIESINVGASSARNEGIKKAKFNFITFIDDDDYIDENYILNLYASSGYGNISITGVKDEIEKTGEKIDSPITQQITNVLKRGRDIGYHDITSVLTMNSCKLVPSYMAKNQCYNETLESGEDVVYWTALIASFQPLIEITEEYNSAFYYRVVTSQSVSRQEESFDFNVLQRLDVISQLLTINTISSYDKSFVQSKVSAQSNFIKRYLLKYPEYYKKFQKEIIDREIVNSFVSDINSLFTKRLVISYCFSPYADTSAVVMSKRINQMENPVDVISNSMSNVRAVDDSLKIISAFNIGKHIELKAPQAFSNWSAIEIFAEQVIQQIGYLISQREMYDEIYSRAMWPASHFAAALVKKKFPRVKWIAEFSDPLLMDVTANKRYEALSIEWLKVHGLLLDQAIELNDNLFYWCEKLVYDFADEVIFTNENQQKYMLSYADKEPSIIQSKSKILPQPTLEEKYYSFSNLELDKEDGNIYVGYFGSFYMNRGFKSFLQAWDDLSFISKSKLRLCVYTQQDKDILLSEIPDNLIDYIIIQPYVSYFDFLSLSRQFDILLVMDAQTKGRKNCNPYLPSKISDYLGSGTKILGLVEENSPMSLIKNSDKVKISILDDKRSIVSVLQEIIS